MRIAIVLILLMLAGCKEEQRSEGLYVNRQLVKRNATIEDFAKEECVNGVKIVELIRQDKVVLSKGLE